MLWRHNFLDFLNSETQQVPDSSEMGHKCKHVPTLGSKTRDIRSTSFSFSAAPLLATCSGWYASNDQAMISLYSFILKVSNILFCCYLYSSWILFRCMIFHTWCLHFNFFVFTNFEYTILTHCKYINIVL